MSLSESDLKKLVEFFETLIGIDSSTPQSPQD